MSNNITDVPENFYKDVKLVIGDSQPTYLIQRDTIKAFLHEKVKMFGIKNRLLGLLGIIITIGLTLATVNFQDFDFISGSTINGFFLSMLVILAIIFGYNGYIWISEIENSSVDDLTQDLGSRAQEVKPKVEAEEEEAT